MKDIRIIKLIFLVLLMLLPVVGKAEREHSVATSSSQVIVNGRVATFGSVVALCDGDSVAAAQISHPLPVKGSYLPAWRVTLEDAFNTIGLRWAAPVISLLLLAFLIAGVSKWRPWCAVAALLLIGEFVVRCLLSERVGLTGSSDCLLAVAMGISLILPLSRNKNTAMAAAVVMSVLSVAGALTMIHPAVRPINPSLDSGWLPIHVGLMVAAYSFFVIGAVGALTDVNVRRLRNVLIIGEAFLVCGIAAGSAWAAEAWGSWWSWDPKETFALVTACIYLLLILLWDFSIGHKMAKTLTVGALALVAITWFGISGLGGLHSYGTVG